MNYISSTEFTCKYLSDSFLCNDPYDKQEKSCIHFKSDNAYYRTENFSPAIYFGPWIGKGYEQGSVFGKKTLVLGNSHYCKNDSKREYAKYYEEAKDCINNNCCKLRIPGCCYNTINSVYEDGYLNFHINLLSVLLNESPSSIKEQYEIKRKLFDKIAFYNFIQEALCNGSSIADTYKYMNSESQFFEVLEKLRPELIIALGVSKMWSSMPSINWCESDYKEYNKCGFYILKDRYKVPIIWIKHPSARGYYDYEYYHKCIADFVNAES